MRKLLFTFFLIHVFFSFSQELSTSNPYYVGHSLVNFEMPFIVNRLAESGNKTSDYDQQVINSASIHSNYSNPQSAQGLPYTSALPTGNYDIMIVTEAIPLVNHTTWSNTYASANDFLTYARNYRNDIRFYIYETWHCINSGRTDTIIPEIDPRKCWYDNNDQLL
jgi:hypothetical protein